MIRLFLDEDVPEAIAIALRLRGYNVVTVWEAGRKGLTDKEQLDYAYSEKRIFFTPLESSSIYAGDVRNRKHQLLI